MFSDDGDPALTQVSDDVTAASLQEDLLRRVQHLAVLSTVLYEQVMSSCVYIIEVMCVYRGHVCI